MEENTKVEAMEETVEEKVTLKERAGALYRKAKPYAIGFGIGALCVVGTAVLKVLGDEEENGDVDVELHLTNEETGETVVLDAVGTVEEAK